MTDLLCKCNWCDYSQTFTVNADIPKRYFAWEEKYLQGQETTESIIDIFPDFSAGDRELLICNTCGDCWDKFFGKGFDMMGLQLTHAVWE